MDDPDHGVLVTIIDLGLARMDAHNADGHHIHWTPFDEEVFEGEGASSGSLRSNEHIMTVDIPSR